MSIAASLKNRISTIILAGGYSTRMGTDKALIEVEGTPLLQRTCQLAQTVASQVSIVTPWGERYKNIIPEGCQIIQETPLPNETPPNGALVGLYQGMQQVDTDWVLALACDLPKLTGEELEFWCQQLESVANNNVALVAKSPEIWHPLSGFYRKKCTALFANYLAEGNRSFQEFLNQHPVAELTVRDRATLFNCNTPEDLDKL
jgi:molybdopterin-guanine dinucleotide biosynthesis protein A